MADAETRVLEVVTNIARKYGYDDAKIDLKPISSGGANYTSRLFSITVSSPGKDDLKLFSKLAVLGEKARSMTAIQVYEIEMIFYTKILSKFRDLEDRNIIPVEKRLFLPQYYGGVTKYSEELMVLEDLMAKGYQSFNRHRCFDWNYATTCIKSLATFHSLSVAWARENPEEYASTVDNLKFNTPKDAMASFLNDGITAAVKATDEIYRDRVEIFLNNEMKKETFLKFFNPDRKVVLSHGDFRPSNILHKTDEDGYLQVAIVDYQMIKQGNPVTDLIYFLICGSDHEFRTKHLHEYFNYYYSAFSECLQLLGIDTDSVYQEKDFREDVKELLPFGLTLATFALLIITVEEDAAPKPEDGIEFDRLDFKASDEFRVRFNELVRDYVALGIL